MTEARCLGPDGAPCLHSYGWATVCMAYDAPGNPTSGAYFGIEGRPRRQRRGYARERMDYAPGGDVPADVPPS
jgi:hypothetical protein